MKILLIDDDPIVLSTLLFRLTKDGHKVFVADEAPQALRMIYRESPDLIISDIMMPYMSGLELLNIINIQLNKRIPVILMSGLSNKEVIDASMNLGAMDYFVKPLKMKDLNHRISRLIN